MKKTISVFLWAISLLCFCFFLFPLANAGTIHITQTTGPVILGTANTTYILDNDITSTGHGIIIAKSNIVLDLNGHTVTFGTDTTLHNRCGVVIPSSYVRSDMPDIPDSCFKGADTIVIKNGNLIHGADGQDCKIIYSNESVRKVEVANIKGKIRGIDGEGFVFLYDYDINIHDDSVETALTTITNRQHAKGVIHVHLSGGSLKVQNNTIWGYGHFGYWMSSKKAYPTTELICSGNKSSVHGITTNSIQLWFSGFSKAQQNTNIQIYNNRVTCPGSVSNRGLYLEGVDASTDGVDGAKIYGNYIECKEHGNVEYGVDGWTHNVRIRDAGDGTKKNFNNEFYSDTFVVNGYWVSADTHGGGWNIRLSNSASLLENEQNLFHDNIITATTSDTHSVCEVYCVGFESQKDYPAFEFYNNTITSNSKIFEWFHGGGDTTTFRSNTLTIGADTTKFKVMKFDSYDAGNTCLGNVFLDNTLGSGISYKNISLAGDQPKSFYVKWYLDINVKDSLGQNVSNAIVKGYDKTNVLRYTDTTDASGNAQLILSEFYFYSSGGTDTNFTYYNPYRITASKGGATSQVEVTMNASKNINVRTSGQNHCPSIPTLNLPANEDTVLGTRPMLSLNNSVDTDGDILVYDFQVCSDSQMTNLVASGTDVLQGEGTTYWQTNNDLLDERWYWWKARSYDGVCYSDWSGERKFYAKRWIAEVEDSQPTLKSPADGATLKNLQPTLEVYNITGFESLVYYFQLDSDTQFTNPVQSGGVLEGSAITSWMVANSLSKGNYCWRARVFDGSKFSRWSEAGTFTVVPEVYIYPNPFKPSSGDENITFTNIPVGSNIKITTLDGKLVKKFTNAQDYQIIWDTKNQEGKNVASGVYLYFVDFPGGSTSGKIVVVR